jgi:GNAT superfamily N-acetyltransferase
MERIARRLEPAEWPEAARVIVCTQRYGALPAAGGVAIGVLEDGHLRGAARVVPYAMCVCRNELPADAHQASRDYRAFLHDNHPNRPHWFVGEVGAEPGLRRIGIGTLALEELMRSITGAGMVCVEAEDDLVAFYERVGFRPTLRTPAPDGAPLTFLEAYV